jgi:hypothetical protein
MMPIDMIRPNNITQLNNKLNIKYEFNGEVKTINVYNTIDLGELHDMLLAECHLLLYEIHSLNIYKNNLLFGIVGDPSFKFNTCINGIDFTDCIFKFTPRLKENNKFIESPYHQLYINYTTVKDDEQLARQLNNNSNTFQSISDNIFRFHSITLPSLNISSINTSGNTRNNQENGDDNEENDDDNEENDDDNEENGDENNENDENDEITTNIERNITENINQITNLINQYITGGTIIPSNGSISNNTINSNTIGNTIGNTINSNTIGSITINGIDILRSPEFSPFNQIISPNTPMNTTTTALFNILIGRTTQMEDVCIVNTEEEINSLKKCKYEDISKKLNTECNICLEEYNNTDDLLVLPCNHYFHTQCIKTWLSKTSNKCPLCKNKVFEGKPLINNEGEDD